MSTGMSRRIADLVRLRPSHRRLTRPLLAALAVMTALPTTLPARAQEAGQDSPWVQEKTVPLAPPDLSSAAMAGHAMSDSVVLVGLNLGVGFGTGGQDMETWSWDGQSWQKQSPPMSPSFTNNGSAMAYHVETERFVRFAHQGGTWTWDGTIWEDLTPEKDGSPCKQAGLASCVSPPGPGLLAEDRNGKLVLFQHDASRDTWTWDGTSWTKEQSQVERPSWPSQTIGMAYDANRRETVLVMNFEDSVSGVHTWVWDGATWTKRNPAQSPPATAVEQYEKPAAITYHAASGRVVLVGWAEGNSTWTWDGNTWAQRAPRESPGRAEGLMSYHGPTARAVFLMSGSAAFSATGTTETWTWDGKKEGPGTGPDLSATVTVTLDPDSLPADGGGSWSWATVSVYKAGLPMRGVHVQLSTDGDALVGLAEEQPNGAYRAPVYSGLKPGTQTIFASAGATSAGPHLGRGSAVLTQTDQTCDGGSGSGARWTDLDPTFGCNGKLLKTFGHHTAASDIAIQPWDQKIVTAGSHVARFLPNGSLDRLGFGNGGVTDGIPGKLVIQEDRKILLVGANRQMRRLTDSGKPDTDNFGSAGIVNLDNFYDVHAAAVQPDGRILVGGSIGNDEFFGSGSDWMVARYNSDGTPDDGGGADSTKGDRFGPNGTVIISWQDEGGFLASTVRALTVQPDDDKIVVAGFVRPGASLESYFGLARLDPSGAIDASFNNRCPEPAPPCGGKVTTNFGDPASLEDVLVQPHDRKIVAVGHTQWARTHWGFALARYNPDGSLDSRFNPCPALPRCGGMVITDHFSGWESTGRGPAGFGPPDAGFARAGDIQEDGKIVVAGYGPWDYGDFLVARYNPNGTLDTCGTPGWVRTQMSRGAHAYGLAIQRDGRIVAGGDAGRSGTGWEYAALARYMGGAGLGPRSVSVSGPAPVAEPTSGTAAAGFSVSLDAPACEEIKVDVATEKGSATPGEDYTPVSTTVVFGAGEQTKAVEVPVLGDDVPEHDEEFSLRLSNARTTASEGLQGLMGSPGEVSIATDVAPATIVDSGGVVGIGDVAVAEPDGGSVPAQFTVTLSGPAVAPVTVRYATSDATATAGADYQATSGTLTIPTGATTATITVPVLGDALVEESEDFVVELSDPGGARLGRAKGTGTILDAGPGISVGDATVVEGNAGTTPARFTVTLNAAPTQAVSVDYASANQSAGAADYRAISGRLDFAPGQRSQVLTVEVVADILDEPDEAFAVSLSNAKGAMVNRAKGTGTILDDDEPPPPAGSQAPPLPDLGPTAPGLAAPAGSTPPPAPLTQAQAQGQSQAQSQAQAQQQLQQQAQQQAQSQAQAQTQAQLQQQAQLQAQAQAQLQPGLMLDRERELGLEKARSGAGGRNTLAASARRQTVPATAMFVWAAALGAFVAALAGRHHSAEAAHLAQLRLSRRRPKT